MAKTRTKSPPGGGDLAGILGLEPRITGPEPVVLPITPYPTDLPVFGSSGRASEPRRNLTLDHSGRPKRPAPQASSWWSGARVGGPRRAPGRGRRATG